MPFLCRSSGWFQVTRIDRGEGRQKEREGSERPTEVCFHLTQSLKNPG